VREVSSFGGEAPKVSLSVSDVCEGEGQVTIRVMLDSDIQEDLHLKLETMDDSALGIYIYMVPSWLSVLIMAYSLAAGYRRHIVVSRVCMCMSVQIILRVSAHLCKIILFKYT